MDQRPHQPYVRKNGAVPDEWHVAVRVLPEGSVIIRCRIVPLAHPLDWRQLAPEVSIDAPMCTGCLAF
jgi:hypothetical protein